MSRSPWRNAALLICLLLSAVAGTKGQIDVKGDPNVSAYPTITCKGHLRNPDVLPKSSFKLTEADKELEFKLDHETPSDSGIARSILVLWEYRPAAKRDAQNKFFRQAILDALPEMLIGEDDEINVATFAWTGKEKGAKALHPLLPTFGKDINILSSVVRDAKAPNGKGVIEALGSELYPAISEGIAALADRESKAKVLIVLSAEFYNILNQTVPPSQVKDEALESDVAIYNLRYKQMNDKYSLDSLASDTYGKSFEVDPKSTQMATQKMVEFAEISALRSAGMDYEFSFQTTTPKDGEAHTFQIAEKGKPTVFTYNAPSKSMGEWIGDNIAIFIGLIVLIIGIGVGIYLLLRKRKQTEEARQAEEKRKLEEVKARSQETEQRVAQQNQQLSQMQREEQDRQRKAEDAKRREEAEREAKTLLTEMYANGRQPRVTTMVNGQPLTMELPSPVTTVGRDPSCDIQFNLNTISRNHFQIIYQNGKYMLLDLGSTNGTSLNGSRVNQAELRHGDEITAGDAILHFFI
jgi:hypothetical protein